MFFTHNRHTTLLDFPSLDFPWTHILHDRGMYLFPGDIFMHFDSIEGIVSFLNPSFVFWFLA